MSTLWTDEAREALIGQHLAGSGWGYSAGTTAFVEPTVLAGLALLSSESGEVGHDAVREAASWLAQIQQPNGAIGLSAELDKPCWGTALAILLWQALGDRKNECKAAADWLVEAHGVTFPKEPNAPIGHDTAIPGWTWVERTHPWLEPTAMAVLALRSLGWSENGRVRDGIRLIHDRVTRTGGWNYGNTTAFGRDLHPQPAPTGLALMALAGTDTDSDVFIRACRYLKKTLPRIRAPWSLGWGVLGLTACDERPENADTWLAESFSRTAGKAVRPGDLGLLLLAADGHLPKRLGIEVGEGARQ